ncbi:rhodanese-like domain-containing protein, partial [Luteimonas sp. TWI1416]
MSCKARRRVLAVVVFTLSILVGSVSFGAETRRETPCIASSAKPERPAAPRSQTALQNGHLGANCLIDAAARRPAGAKIVDIRSRAEYSPLHIPGAVNQPLQSLMNAGAGSLIVYDNGRFRSDSLQLCNRLARYGVRDFKVIDGGIAAWAQSARAPGAPDVSRLSDAEVSAALVAGGSKIVPLAGSFSTILRGRSQESSATRDLKSMISLSITWAGVAQPSVLRGRPF